MSATVESVNISDLMSSGDMVEIDSGHISGIEHKHMVVWQGIRYLLKIDRPDAEYYGHRWAQLFGLKACTVIPCHSVAICRDCEYDTDSAGSGVLIEWIDGTQTYSRVYGAGSEPYDTMGYPMMTLDSLMYNWDRHPGNVIVDDDDIEIPIDYGHAFTHSMHEWTAKEHAARIMDAWMTAEDLDHDDMKDTDTARNEVIEYIRTSAADMISLLPVDHEYRDLVNAHARMMIDSLVTYGNAASLPATLRARRPVIAIGTAVDDL